MNLFLDILVLVLGGVALYALAYFGDFFGLNLKEREAKLDMAVKEIELEHEKTRLERARIFLEVQKSLPVDAQFKLLEDEKEEA